MELSQETYKSLKLDIPLEDRPYLTAISHYKTGVKAVLYIGCNEPNKTMIKVEMNEHNVKSLYEALCQQLNITPQELK